MSKLKELSEQEREQLADKVRFGIKKDIAARKILLLPGIPLLTRILLASCYLVKFDK
jgi:hypothetical protein